ncbi:DMT family transporter [Alicyclobacillus dauci]|uniref:Multidrug resistance efflux transporter family protein n=1 Tax=Alicyclobacillus dauci TaxID=1475485 RepID=A0ABY6YYU7_9BACL|nr:multidrug resistance efflux transporter family protein [Alicyclobacillus dauci]WAH35617.1 multidrug resistance efflux transporter family protein [Alicyclobacillus dauci]
MRAIFLGICASFFFASSFVLNRMMSNGGGSWIWSASLRYIFMLPLLLLIVLLRGQFTSLVKEIRKHPWQWFSWSFVGFGLFYAPLCFSSEYSPAWLVAGTWQFTIVAGSLMTPLFHTTGILPNGVPAARTKMPLGALGMSTVILGGIILMEIAQVEHVKVSEILLGGLPVIVAAFAYPLGNRKMMQLCEGRLTAVQRTLGMTICSLPLWIVLSVYQWIAHGLPSENQTVQSCVVAVCSGVIATVLFFSATDMARGNAHQLAAVEATQAGEVVFTLLGEWMLIPGTTISVLGLVGLFIVVVGMVLHSFSSSRGHQQAKENQVFDVAP